MPKHYHIIDLPDLKIEKITSDRNIEVTARIRKKPQCVNCGFKRIRIKSTFYRHLKHSRQGNRFIFVRLRSHKFYCKKCHKFFNLRIRGLLPRRRSTETFRLEVFERHQGGITQNNISRTHLISTATVERWYQDYIFKRIQELKSRPCPRILGIDEHFFTRKKGYATTLVDLANHKVFDVVLGRSEASLRGYLNQLKEKDRVRVVVMDLSETYRSLIHKFFPNALIVSDRFHVVRLINHQFLKAWQQIDPSGRKNRGLLSLMRRHTWNLSDIQKLRLNHYLDHQPALKIIYDFKHKLMSLMILKTLTRSTAGQHAPVLFELIEQLTNCPIEPLKQLGKTLRSWLYEIGRMWRFRKTNSITEGFHNKMEMISRRAFGFRNFNNYRMRVLALCGWNEVFNRV